jgi:hypothetical protein
MKINTRTRSYAQFTDDSGQPADPTVVTCTVTTPAGSTVYTYGQGAEIVRTSTGFYRYEHVPATVGAYRYVWLGTGAVDAADVAATYMAPP